MNHKERIKFINNFFDNLSIEEFEQMVFEASFGEIKESCESSYILATKILKENDNEI